VTAGPLDPRGYGTPIASIDASGDNVWETNKCRRCDIPWTLHLRTTPIAGGIASGVFERALARFDALHCTDRLNTCESDDGEHEYKESHRCQQPKLTLP
jgi:hypothetical protein